MCPSSVRRPSSHNSVALPIPCDYVIASDKGEEPMENTIHLTLLKGKLHRAAVTECAIDYEGSIKIDADLLDAVGILSYERVLIANLANGERFETYAIPGDRGSGEVCLNGATAHKGSVGDRVIIFAFALVPHSQSATHKPRVLLLDENNRECKKA